MVVTLPLPEPSLAGVLYLLIDATMQNQFFAESLQDRLKFPCRIVPQFPSETFEVTQDGPRNLVLLDFEREGAQGIQSIAQRISTFNASVYGLVINVPRESSIATQCLQWGMRGIFHVNDSFGHLVKGIVAILKDELWFTRQALYQFIDGGVRHEPMRKSGNSLLSLREQEILQALPLGKSNEEIAEMLTISPHTVKNHLTKIYRKINVTNRLQAIFWASRHL